MQKRLLSEAGRINGSADSGRLMKRSVTSVSNNCGNNRSVKKQRTPVIYYVRKKKMKKVITYGTFDLLHYGHVNLLQRAKAYGDYLIVALSTDEFNWNEKQKKCYFSYEKRKKLLEASGMWIW